MIVTLQIHGWIAAPAYKPVFLTRLIIYIAIDKSQIKTIINYIITSLLKHEKILLILLVISFKIQAKTIHINQHDIQYIDDGDTLSVQRVQKVNAESVSWVLIHQRSERGVKLRTY